MVPAPTSTANGAGAAASGSRPLLDPKDAVKELATYATGDGLSMAELIDSRVHGGLTYNGA